MAATPISFDGNNLQTFDGTHGIIVAEIDHHGTPEINAPLYQLAHSNANAIPFTNYPSKPIPVSGRIIGSSIADLDSLIDTFKFCFVGKQKNLDIGYAGSTRRYIGSARAIPMPRPNGLFSASFDMTFDCQPFGYDITDTIALNVTGRTSGGYTDVFSFTGTAPDGQQPVFTITYTALSASGSQSAFVGNAGTGQQITVTRTWTAGDVLVVDCKLKSVTVNGAKVAFSGAFPMFLKGSQTITYGDTFTSRTFSESVNYKAIWF
jgi:hypothetical protein